MMVKKSKGPNPYTTHYIALFKEAEQRMKNKTPSREDQNEDTKHRAKTR